MGPVEHCSRARKEVLQATLTSAPGNSVRSGISITIGQLIMMEPPVGEENNDTVDMYEKCLDRAGRLHNQAKCTRNGISM